MKHNVTSRNATLFYLFFSIQAIRNRRARSCKQVQASFLVICIICHMRFDCGSGLHCLDTAVNPLSPAPKSRAKTSSDGNGRATPVLYLSRTHVHAFELQFGHHPIKLSVGLSTLWSSGKMLFGNSKTGWVAMGMNLEGNRFFISFWPKWLYGRYIWWRYREQVWGWRPCYWDHTLCVKLVWRWTSLFTWPKAESLGHKTRTAGVKAVVPARGGGGRQS